MLPEAEMFIFYICTYLLCVKLTTMSLEWLWHILVQRPGCGSPYEGVAVI